MRTKHLVQQVATKKKKPLQGLVSVAEGVCSAIRTVFIPQRPSSTLLFLLLWAWLCYWPLTTGTSLPTSRHAICHVQGSKLNNLLSAGLIRLSSSLLGAGFFFVEKKDKTCRPCIDYQGLIEMTIKNKYLLPLIDLSFEPLCHSKYFTKLDLPFALRSFCDCISPGDEWKTAFNTALRHLPSCFPSTNQQHSFGYA